MSMSWNESTRSQSPTRPTYLPPHLRYQPPITDSISSSPYRPPRLGWGLGHGRGSRSRGPNQDRSWGGGSRGRWRFRETFSDPGPGPYPYSQSQAQPFRSSESFDELEVVEEGLSNVNLDAYDDTPVETSGFDIPSPVWTSGVDVPPSMNSFADVHFSAALMENIKRCNYVKPTPIQRYAIPVAMAGRDLMACAQTGSGKTAAFCFPIISGVLKEHAKTPAQILVEGRGLNLNMACPLALILAPTRELSCQIHDEAMKFAYKTGVKIVVAYGGAPFVQQFHNLERGVDILVATPGRLVDMIERARVSLRNVKFLALDEADRMLDMGFEPQLRRIVQQMEMPRAGVRQTMLFSATFPNEIEKLASDFLSNYIFLSAGKVGSSTDLITQKVQFVADMDKKSRLMSLLLSQRSNDSQGKPILTLVFVETKRVADALQQWLSMKGFPSIAIHGDKVQLERERALRSFRTGVTPILVATGVAARGLDIPHVAHVINYDLPRGIDEYVHRIGRTGRAGKPGLATAFFSDKNAPLAKALVELMMKANQEIPSWLSEYAETYSSSFTPRVNCSSGLKFGWHDHRRVAPTESQRQRNFSSKYIAAVKGGPAAEFISQKTQFISDMDKKTHLMSLLRSQRSNGSQRKPILTLVFVETKRGADALQLWLSMKGFPSIAIHGDKVQLERERALRSFRTGVTPILVATDVAARGLDIPHVAHVINYDLPRDIDAYVHRIGRTGRAGKSGLATAFFSDKNVPLAKALVEVMVEANQEVPSWLLEYAETYSSSEGFTPGVKRNSGLKFGGSDYRRGASSGNERYDYLNQIADPRDVQPYGDGASSLYSCRSSCAGYYIPSASDGLYSHMYGYHPFDACLSGIDVSSLPCKGTATMAVIYPGGILIGGDSRYNRKYTNFPDFVQYGDYPYKIHQLHPFLMATVAGLLTFAADAIIMLESRADNYAKSHNYSPMPVLTAAQELFKIIQDAIRAGRFERGSVHTEFLVAGFEWDKPSIYKVDEYNIYPSHKHADIQGFQWVNSGTGGTILEGYVVDRCKRTGLTEEVHLTESIILGLLATTLQDKDTGNTATVQKISEYGCKPMFYRLSLPKLLNAGVNPNNFL
ncbi:OLC1v1037108C1 [Oldenlandia corymbosa var. corymbosa]|uniref:RNA helicase n=1 Tax=Oldenlandia corymbosa var. corymbosa TaxID=529605 RepID=A0AAV1D021_OLDCO|nr:OLC1v1037108C1 [Oldenlandia corymbosa var. corymbosa]